MTKYETRDHAVTSYGHHYGKYLREMSSPREMQEFLRHKIDLADLPDSLADKYGHSDRAWHRFLNDIIRYSRGGRP